LLHELLAQGGICDDLVSRRVELLVRADNRLIEKNHEFALLRSYNKMEMVVAVKVRERTFPDWPRLSRLAVGPANSRVAAQLFTR
jgi:hypothetical protein